MLSVENVTSSYGRIQALHGVSLVVAAGELVTLVGANGAGKTTLIRAISGVQPISGGRIMFENRSIDRMPAACTRRARNRAGARRPATVRPAVGRGQSQARGMEPARRRHRGRACRRLRPVSHARGPPRRDRRHAVRRPAADAGDRPRPDGEAAAAAARRALDGTCPDAGRADPRGHRRASNARA